MYVVATISKNSYPAEKIKEILGAGATILRYNFSHGTPDEMREKIQTAREVIAALNLVGQVKIMADLPGGKIRLGHFSPEPSVHEGDVVTFRSAKTSEDPLAYIPVDYPAIGALVAVGQEISCADGELGFMVTKVVDQDTFVARALNSRHIPELKALNIGSAMDEMDHFTPAMLDHLKVLHAINPELVAFSFVNSKEYLFKAKQLLQEYNPTLRPLIVSKVETEKGVANIKEIVAESDYILIARGDLGLTVPIERIGIYQKLCTKEALAQKKQVIVSTQVLDSVVTQYIPSRAEVLDVTNAVLDGASGIMLAKETGISATPGQSVRTLRKIITYVESHRGQIENG